MKAIRSLAAAGVMFAAAQSTEAGDSKVQPAIAPKRVTIAHIETPTTCETCGQAKEGFGAKRYSQRLHCKAFVLNNERYEPRIADFKYLSFDRTNPLNDLGRRETVVPMLPPRKMGYFIIPRNP